MTKIKLATMADLEYIWALFEREAHIFPHVRKAKVIDFIEKGQCCWEQGVVLTFNRYKRKQKVGDWTAVPGDYRVYHVIATTKGNGSAGDITKRFRTGKNVYTSVRADNKRAVAALEKHGYERGAVVHWGKDKIKGYYYRRLERARYFL